MRGNIFIICRIIFCIIIYISSTFINAQTNVSGNISINSTWTITGSPYIVTSSVTVNSGVILTIEPGVIIKFNSGTSLVIDGEIIARGLQDKQITFTSNMQSPQPGDWGSIMLTGNSVQNTYNGKTYIQGSILEYCIIEYAGLSSASIRLQTKAAPFLKNIIIRNGNSSGICTEGYRNQTGIQTIPVVNSTITNNKSYGIYTCWDSRFALFNTTLTKNGSTAVAGDVYSGASFDSCTISYNAGGINLWSYVSISNSIIANNSSDGIALPSYMSVSCVNAYNCKFINNGGAAINLYGDKGASSIQNCLFKDNGINILFNVKPTQEVDKKCQIINNIFIDDNNLSICFKVLVAPAIHVANNVFISNSTYEILNTQNDVEFTNNLVIINNCSSNPSGKLIFYKVPSKMAQNNLFNNTKAFDIYNNLSNASGNLTADNNFWNTINSDSIKSRIFDWYTDSTKSKVIFSPFLSSPNTSAPISPPQNVTKYLTAQGVKIQWKANPESDIAGYKIYWKNSTGYSFSNSVNAGNVTTYFLSGASITDTIAVTAYDKSATGNNDLNAGNESWFSEAVSSSITLSSPAGNENWLVGSTQYIGWTCSNVSNVKIEYSTDNGTNWFILSNSTAASTGIYTWTIPNTPSTQCKVRISDINNSLLNSISNNFSIYLLNPIIITNPVTLPDFGNVIVNAVSTTQSYTLSGTNLASNVTVTAPSGFKVSINSTSGFTSQLTLLPVNGTLLNTTIYTIFCPGTAQSYKGEITNSSLSAVTKNVEVTGTGIPTEGASLKPVIESDSVSKGSEFWVQIKVGDPNTITDLYGISFKLTSNNGYCTYTDGSAVNLDFLGSSPLFFARITDSTTVDIASTKTSTPGVNGSGMIVKVKFKSSDKITANQKVVFSFHDITATNSTGNPITITAFTDTVVISIIPYIPVWPGDCNNDSSVSAADIIPIGLYYGQTISVSNAPGNQWKAYNRQPWNLDGTTPKRIYADANGDGVINSSDILPIGLNYGKKQSISTLTKNSPIKYSVNNNIPQDKMSNASLKIQGPSNALLNSIFSISVIIGDPIQVTDLFGISFKIKSDSKLCSYIDSSAQAGAFLGSKVLKFFKIVDDQTIDAAITRTELPGADGNGLIASFNFCSTVKQTVLFSIYDVNAIDSQGNSIQLDVSSSDILISKIINENKIPTEYQLNQNYPNPFNPSTTISFAIPKSSFVTIKIFDILGKEKNVLLNEYKSPGNYSVQFTANNEFASGLYFYRMQADNYKETKKLILIK